MIKVRLVKKIDGIEVQNGDTITLGLKVGMPGAKGRSVISIIKTATQELTDTYTITYSDNTTSTFDVVNGTNGTDPYVEAVARGYEGTEEEFYTDLATISSKQDKTDTDLQTDDKTVVGAINEVNLIAKGANQALSFDNYQAVIAAMLVSGLKEGQNLYVDTLDVPDLWIKTVELTSVAYTYTTDDQFVIDILAGVQIGYYKLALLETQKVDLTNYYNKGEVDNLLDDKSDVIHNHSGQSINPDNVVINKQYTDIEAEALPVGTIFYNTDQKCWLLKLSSVNYYNFGEELPVLSRIGDNQNHLEGQACFISGGSTQLNNVSLASSVTGKLNCLATQDVLNTGDKTGYYCYFGQVRKFPYANVIKSTDNADTWVDGADLYLCNEAGRYSTVKEAAPAKASYVGRITNRNGANITVMFIPIEAKATTDLSDWDGSTNAFADAEKILIRKTNGLVQEMTKTDFYAILDDYFAKLSGGNTFSGKQILSATANDELLLDVVGYIRTTNKTSPATYAELAYDTTKGAIFKTNGSLFTINVQGDLIQAYPNSFRNLKSRYEGVNGLAYLDLYNTGTGNIVLWNSLNYPTIFGTNNIERLRILGNGDLNFYIGKYQFNAASPTADTINDTRKYNLNGVEIHEVCTGNSTTKGGGTWVETYRVDGVNKRIYIDNYTNWTADSRVKIFGKFASFEAIWGQSSLNLMSFGGDVSLNPNQGFAFDAIVGGHTNSYSGKYQYNAASKSADTINDRRTSNNAGVKIEERCTGNSATKGGGTWVVDTKIHSNGINEYADNSAAIAAGLTIGTFYRTGDFLKIVH